MNITSNNITSTAINTLIEGVYEAHVFNWILTSSLALPLYDMLLRFSQEVEHIWFKPFSLPTFLYILTRYGVLVTRALRFFLSLDLIPLGRPCNMLANATNSVDILAYIGVQGLLVARAYSMCRGNKILTAALVLGFLASFVSKLVGIIAFPGCFVNNDATEIMPLILITNISVIYTDTLIFGIIMWNVLGIWKLKREAGIHNDRGLVSVLLSQSISRFCFVILLTVSDAVISALPAANSPIFFLINQGFVSYQNVLSSILVASFTLDLRQLNSAKIEASNVSLPSLHLPNVLQHIHQSFVVELATPEVRNNDDLERVGNLEGISRTADDMDIQPAQV